MAIQIQYRRGTASEWTSSNPTLASGEPGYETDTGRFKVGNGSTAWNSLSYSSGPPGDKGGVPYVFSTTTTAADPGTGTVRYNNSTFGSISTIYIDNTDINSVSMTSWYDTWPSSTNPNKGILTIMSRKTGVAVGLFTVTSVASISGYYQIVVTPITGTIPANNEEIIVFFSTFGDKGDTGVTGAKGGLFYTFSTTTTDADPGAGFFRFNATNTQMFIDLVDGDGVTQTNFIDAWDDSTSTIEGYLIIQSRDTSLYSSVWSITGWTTATGYRKLTVANVSGTTPGNNQQCVIQFIRTGDKGATGASPGATWNFSTTTTAADPTAGNFRFNNATIASVTEIYISETDSVSSTRISLLDSVSQSTETIKSYVTFMTSDGSPVIFAVTGQTDNGTWRTWNVQYITGSLPSNGENRALTVSRTGDRGATGSMGPKAISILAPTNAENITLFYTSSALTVSKISSAIRGGTSVTFTIRYGTNRSDTGTEVVTGGTVANSTTGLYTTSFNSASIPANRWVWLATTAVSGTVNELAVSLEF